MSKKTDALIPLLKEKYEYEIERKRYYDNVIMLPVSLIAFIIAGLYVIISDNSITVVWFNLVKKVLTIFLMLGASSSMFFLFLLFFEGKKKYKSFPISSVIKSDYEDLENYYVTGTPQRSKLINEDFNGYIVGWYIDINDNNIVVNDKRSQAFQHLKICIGISYILGIILFVAFFLAKMCSNPTLDKEIRIEKNIAIQNIGIEHPKLVAPTSNQSKRKKRAKHPCLRKQDEKQKLNEQQDKNEQKGATIDSTKKEGIRSDS